MEPWRAWRSKSVSAALAAAVGASCCSLGALAADSTERKPPYAWPGEVAPELERIQRELGGSAVDRFDALKEATTPAWATDRNGAWDTRVPNRPAVAPYSPQAPGWGQPQVESLREAASQIDQAANRLERLELYSQADALREQAQRLRLDARNMSGGVRSTSRSSAVPNRPQDEPRLAPSLVPTPAQPLHAQPTPAPDATPPALEPSPRPLPSGASPDDASPRPTEPASATAPPAPQPAPAAELSPTPAPENEEPAATAAPVPLQE